MSNWRLGWRFIKGIDILPHFAGGVAAPQALHECDPHFLSRERKRASPVQKKGVCIASEQLEELQCLPIALPIARRCRVSIAIRFDLLLLSAAALLIL